MLNFKRTLLLLLALAFLCSAPGYAVDVKISALPAATTLGATDVFPIVQGGTTKKITTANALTYFQALQATTPGTQYTGNLNISGAGIFGLVTIDPTGLIKLSGATKIDLTTAPGNITLTSPLTSTAGSLTGAVSNAGVTLALDGTQFQNQLYTYFTTGGTTTAYTLTPTPAIAALAAGQRFSMLVNATNTGASTLAVSGKTATAIKKWSTAGAVTDVVAGDMVLNTVAEVVYDGTQFLLLNPAKVAAATLAGTPTGTILGTTDTQTLTNKTVKPRVVDQVNNDATMTSGNTEYNVDNADIFTWTALAQGTDFGVPGGTPYDGQSILFRIKGTAARALTWNACWNPGTVPGVLPTTTDTTKTTYCKFIYNANTSVWDYVGNAGPF